MRFGEYFEQQRILLGESIRAFARRHRFDPSYLSKLERGVVKPPRDLETLKKLAKSINLESQSEDWHEFLDLAAMENGLIPFDLQEDLLRDTLMSIFQMLREEHSHALSRIRGDRWWRAQHPETEAER